MRKILLAGLSICSPLMFLGTPPSTHIVPYEIHPASLVKENPEELLKKSLLNYRQVNPIFVLEQITFIVPETKDHIIYNEKSKSQKSLNFQRILPPKNFFIKIIEPKARAPDSL